MERVHPDPTRGTAEIIAVRPTRSAATDRREAALDFLASQKTLLKLDDPRAEMRLRREATDELGFTHLRFDQEYAGLRVWGCQKVVHFDAQDRIYMAAGQTVPTPRGPTIPRIDPSAAERTALAEVASRTGVTDLTASNQLLIFPDGSVGRLAWMITVRAPGRADLRWRVFVNALTGPLILAFNDVAFDGPALGSGIDVHGVSRPLNTYQVGGRYKLIDASHPMFVPPVDSLRGVIVTYDNWRGDGPITTDPDFDNVFDDLPALRAAVSAHYFAQRTFEYFLTTFGRNSYDDSGTTIIVSVHDPTSVNNAFWTDGALNFGDGDGINFRPFSGDLDVVAHELSHGVTEATSDLIYAFQSGALSEHYSDFFGVMVERENWLIGDDIMLSAPGFLRSMSDPALAGQPGHMSDYQDLSIYQDNGGVHINSGIGNRAGYLVATLLDRERAEQIWYRAWTLYMTPDASYPFWALVTLQAASDLFGVPSIELDAVAAAMDSVGLAGVYATPGAFTPLAATLGGVHDTIVTVFNLGGTPIIVDSAMTTRSEVTISGVFPVTLGLLDTSNYRITLDASSLLTSCDVGRSQDTITFFTSSAQNPAIPVPLTVQITYVETGVDTNRMNTSCTELVVPNTPGFDDLVRDSIDALFDGSLIIGLRDGTDTLAYWDLYEPDNFGIVDTFVTDTSARPQELRSLRFVTPDRRLLGRVTYRFDAAGTDCDHFLIDYVVRNECDTPQTFLCALFVDADLPGFTINHGQVVAGRELVMIRDDLDRRAVGLAFLSGEARNLRCVNNPAIIWDGFTAAEAYAELAATVNSEGPVADDWSALLTFGEVTLAAGDSVAYSAALIYSNTGTPGVIATAGALGSGDCPVAITGDANGDGNLTSSDIVRLVNFVFKAGPPPSPVIETGDTNCDGNVNSADIIRLVNFVFKSQAPPCDVCSIL